MAVPEAEGDDPPEAPPPAGVVAFACRSCGRDYRVAVHMAGRKVRCKDCGVELKVPADSTAAAPASASGPSLFDDDEDDGAAYGLAPESALPATRKPPAEAEAPASTSRAWMAPSKSRTAPSDGENPLLKQGAGLAGFGLFAFVLPFFGLTLGRAGGGLPPEVTQGVGGVCMAVGLIMVGVGKARGQSSPRRSKSSGGKPHPSIIGLAILVPAVIGLLAVFRPGARDAPAPPAPVAGFPPAAAPGMPPAAPVFNPPPASPAPPPPASRAKVTLTRGIIRPRTTPLGTVIPGVDIEVDYQVDTPADPTDRFVLVIEGRAGKGVLTTFHLEPRGTLGGSSFQESVHNGPFQAWMEVEDLIGEGGRVVSNRITLQVEQPPTPTAQPGQPGFPGMGPNGLPGPPPGFPRLR
jgi:hypothetical protein